MDEAERVSSLIGDIYDAALDPSLWLGVMEQTSNYVVGVAATLQSHDILQQNASFFFTWNDDPEYTKSYVEKYARLNPAIVPSMMQTKVGEVSTFLDFVPLE